MENSPEEESRRDGDPFAWMRPFTSGAAGITTTENKNPQYAPPATDPLLRRAQDEEMLDEQIRILAIREAYSTNNLGWFDRFGGCGTPEIVSDYLLRHPAMERFVKAHREANTCANAVTTLIEEQKRRQTGGEAHQGFEEISNAEAAPKSLRSVAVKPFVADFISQAKEAGLCPTKKHLYAAWEKAGQSGHRKNLEDEFNVLMGSNAPKRGRPSKNRQ